jgi:hypothetical protein
MFVYMDVRVKVLMKNQSFVFERNQEKEPTFHGGSTKGCPEKAGKRKDEQKEWRHSFFM